MIQRDPYSTTRSDEPLPLFDYGQHAAETRATTAREARPKQSGRRAQVLAFVRQRGRHGATRDEISAAMDWPIQSTTSPTLSLLRSGLLVETAERRPTRNGSLAVVIVAADREVK